MGTVPRAYQARASSENGPSESASLHASRTLACCSSASERRYWPDGPTANVNGSQKSSKPAQSAWAESAPPARSTRPTRANRASMSPLAVPRQRPLSRGAGRDLAHRAPEQPQHRHPTLRDIPHAGGDNAAGARDACHLSYPLLRISHEAEHEGGEHRVELPVWPRQLLGRAHADVRTRIAVTACLGELRGRVDRGNVAGANPPDKLARQTSRPAAHVKDAHTRLHARGIGERDGERRCIAPHEAVVLLSRRGELHRENLTQTIT